MSGPNSFFESQTVQVGRVAKSLPEQVAEQLLVAIAEGALGPGERLKEEVFAERFVVSRSTIREAIALLERRGIVERVARYGARIVMVDAGEIEEIFNIRAQLLGLAARLAVEKGSDELIGKLQAQAAKLRKLANDPATEPADYASTSIETQRVLVAANGRKRLVSIYEDLSNHSVWQNAVREKSISFRTAQRRMESADDWERLVAAIAVRDADGAERNAKALLQASYRAVKDELEGKGN
jgi:DNA-binding GntR family transcriptional regulator